MTAALPGQNKSCIYFFFGNTRKRVSQNIPRAKTNIAAAPMEKKEEKRDSMITQNFVLSKKKKNCVRGISFEIYVTLYVMRMGSARVKIKRANSSKADHRWAYKAKQTQIGTAISYTNTPKSRQPNH